MIDFFRAEVTLITRKTAQQQILLRNITAGTELFRDHVWVNMSKRLSQVSVGDTIAFRASIVPYDSKGITKLSLRTLRNIIVLKDT